MNSEKKKPSKAELNTLKPGERCWIDRGIFARMTATKGLVYGISYEYEGRRYREAVGPHLGVARKALEIRRAEITQGRFEIPNKTEAPIFHDFCQTYLEHAEQHKRSCKRDAGVMRQVKAFFERKPIDQVTAWDIQRYQAARAKQVTSATTNREVAIIKRMFALAVTWKLLAENPAKEVKLFKEHERAIRALDEHEEAALLEACSPHLFPIVVVALNTGMRRGELYNLRWQHVDLGRGLITVAHSKSGKLRHIPTNAHVQQALMGLDGPREGYVFKKDGKQLTTTQRAFATAARRAGIQQIVPHPETGRKQRWPTLHTCRHTFGTNLVLGGMDLVTVKELMGHADISMTLRYSHPTPESKRNAVDLLVRKVAHKWPMRRKAEQR